MSVREDPARVALITGASAGIGAELARVFAMHGHRVALVARRLERLREVAAALPGAVAQEPIVIACDLSRPDAGETIATALAAAGAQPDYVVNNAGFGLFGAAAQSDRAAQLAMIDVNIRALTDLSLRFVPSLVRYRGGIMNVASVAGFLPGPNMAVYYASKAYIISFTEALHRELAPQGVRVTALCPGPVPTEFQMRAGIAPTQRTRMPPASASSVARKGYDGLMAGRRMVMPGFANQLVPLLVRFAPRGLVLKAMGRLQAHRSLAAAGD